MRIKIIPGGINLDKVTPIELPEHTIDNPATFLYRALFTCRLNR